MHTCLLRGLDHFLWIRLAKTRDVLGHCATEQFDVLGQIADVGTKVVAIPAMDVRAVQAHHAGQGRPDTHQHPGQCGFTGTRGTQHAQHFPGTESEADSV
ncbi:hypothetical protein D3C85_867720 [compost metagenome]